MVVQSAPSASPSRVAGRPFLVIPTAAAVGVVGGIVTDLGENAHWLGPMRNELHTLSWWGVITVLVGAALRGQPRLAALAGLVTQLGLVVSYYLAQAAWSEPVWAPDRSVDLRRLAVYGTLALVTGPAWGAAGACFRDQRDRVRWLSLGLIGAPFFIDSSRELLLLPLADVFTSQTGLAADLLLLLVALVLPGVLGRSHRDWVVAVAIEVALAAPILALELPRLLGHG